MNDDAVSPGPMGGPAHHAQYDRTKRGVYAAGSRLLSTWEHPYPITIGEERLLQPDQLGRHLDGALERMQHCTSDPLCAEHHCVQDHSLHEAACHACLFLPETSCERGNKYLDRSVLVPTVDRVNLAFFDETW